MVGPDFDGRLTNLEVLSEKPPPAIGTSDNRSIRAKKQLFPNPPLKNAKNR
jgi:hypothetical protein